jgi:hypothetical protein
MAFGRNRKMTMLIEFRGDCYADPAKRIRLDLDDLRDREAFETADAVEAAMEREANE